MLLLPSTFKCRQTSDAIGDDGESNKPSPFSPLIVLYAYANFHFVPKSFPFAVRSLTWFSRTQSGRLDVTIGTIDCVATECRGNARAKGRPGRVPSDSYLCVTPIFGNWCVHFGQWWRRHSTDRHITTAGRRVLVGCYSSSLTCRTVAYYRQPTDERRKGKH